MNMTSETHMEMIDMAGRWQFLDPLKGLIDTEKFIRQGQKDISFLFRIIESHAKEIDRLKEELVKTNNEWSLP